MGPAGPTVSEYSSLGMGRPASVVVTGGWLLIQLSSAYGSRHRHSGCAAGRDGCGRVSPLLSRTAPRVPWMDTYSDHGVRPKCVGRLHFILRLACSIASS